ncbi:MAG: Inositol-1-monophosphatase (EC [uncultured Sulfurovum sp.]|uniref:Inositol-1-monophosphatase n=1 Tax=uncultured Sulfurovum sp. TaxID=269237 RepID=A0A6S6TW66_9BACT|nr:MAG: Inositol-1-monophosphatase (EC [uncultured Sulfurovum sp.]
MKTELIQIIKEASKIFKEGYYGTKKTSFKGKKDLVTQYDLAVEAYLKERFSEVFPNFNIIAEESDNKDITFYNSIIIDPIDGTTNFVKGLEHCAISVGVYKEKKPYIGIVYNPILEQLYTAEIGQGAYLNGEQIFVNQDHELMTTLIGTGFPYTGASNKDDLNFVIKNLETILPKCQDIRRLGSAALDICMVASGVYGGFYEINLKAWDISAGVIILHEAGGKVSNIDAEDFDMFKDKCLIVSNEKIHNQLLALLEN